MAPPAWNGPDQTASTTSLIKRDYPQSVQIWGVTMARDEADIIEITARHMLAQGLDGLLIADNLSCDGTRAILDRLAEELPVRIVDDREVAYHQGRKMTALATQAAGWGAHWIVPFDADELWSGYGETVRDVLERAKTPVVTAQLFDFYPRPTLRRGSAPERMRWSRTGMMKVAFRWAPGVTIATGNHDVKGTGPLSSGLMVAHYPYRSYSQFKRKLRQGTQAADRAGLPPHLVAHWRAHGYLADWQLRMAWWRRRLELRARVRDL